ncbi:hypothetical protein DMA11_11335 [Marinilabiliaceae bacterium JC017]|nr:hypothetical protein DMA11_11335 [Marinilabiliaceae bacterium JC017]
MYYFPLVWCISHWLWSVSDPFKPLPNGISGFTVFLTGLRASDHHGLAGDLEICVIVTLKKNSVPWCFCVFIRDVVPYPTYFLALPQKAKRSSQINASAHLLDEFFPTHRPELPHSSSSRLRRPAYLTGLRASDHHGLAGDLETCVIVTFKKNSVPRCFCVFILNLERGI